MKFMFFALLAASLFSFDFARSDSRHGNIDVEELEGSGLDSDQEVEFEKQLAELVSKDFKSKVESIEVNYSCTYSALVAEYCVVNVYTEFGSYGAYAVDFDYKSSKENAKKKISVLKKRVSI